MVALSDISQFASADSPVVPPEGQLQPNSVIHIDDLPWIGWINPNTGEPDPYIFSKVVVDPQSRNSAALVRMEPGYQGTAHWHLSDTLYIPRSGEMHLEGEGVYKVGDVRWVRGGTPYSPELPGKEPVEFFLISFGPSGRFDAEKYPAPRRAR